MLNMYIDGNYSHLMSLLAETAIMSVYEISSLFSNFLLIACDSVILDSLKHVFYIVLHMNLTLSLFLSLYLTHSFFRFSLFLFLSVLNPPRSLTYLPFWTITI